MLEQKQQGSGYRIANAVIPEREFMGENIYVRIRIILPCADLAIHQQLVAQLVLRPYIFQRLCLFGHITKDHELW